MVFSFTVNRVSKMKLLSFSFPLMKDFLSGQLYSVAQLVYVFHKYSFRMDNYWKGIVDNAFVSRAMTYVRDYTYTMKDLMLNTLDEIQVLPEQLSNFGLPCPGSTILLSACCSMLGLFITFTIIMLLLKFLRWIVLGSESPHYGEKTKREFVWQSHVQARHRHSASWFKQAWYDLMAARNDFECHQPAPEWVCYKSLQALEKALKALVLASNSSDTVLITDDVYELATMTGDTILRDKARAVQSIIGLTHRLRYPDTFLPPSTPRETFSLSDALNVYGITQSAMDLIRHRMMEYIEVDF